MYCSNANYTISAGFAVKCGMALAGGTSYIWVQGCQSSRSSLAGRTC